jgi:hypothetical protein
LYYAYGKLVLAVAEARGGFPDRPSGPPLRAPEQGQVAQDRGCSLLHHRANLRDYFPEIRPDRVRTEPLAVERRPGDSMCPAARVFLDEPDLCGRGLLFWVEAFLFLMLFADREYDLDGFVDLRGRGAKLDIRSRRIA